MSQIFFLLVCQNSNIHPMKYSGNLVQHFHSFFYLFIFIFFLFPFPLCILMILYTTCGHICGYGASELILKYMNVRLLRLATGSVMFSTLEDGKIVRGLAGVPHEGPVLIVGNHNLMGLELNSLVEEFLREKNIMVRGAAHPELFWGKSASSASFDWLKVFGAVPVTAKNLFKLLSSKSHVLLYPGGGREALHFKVCQAPSLCHLKPNFQ